MSGETRFVQYVEMLPVVIILRASRKVTLQGAGFDAGFFQFVGGAGCRGKAFDTIAVAFGCASNRCQSGCLACSAMPSSAVMRSWLPRIP